MSICKDQTVLEEQLNSFTPAERRSALEELRSLVSSGQTLVQPMKAESNLHFHTFFSFNAYGWSPSRIAWEGLKYGLEVAGIVDFDVLDGMDEFLSAAQLLGLKGTSGLETRVFISELSDKVISSPNEPGIAYFMASGCFKQPASGTKEERILTSMRETARSRNIAMVERVNAYLDKVQLDYEQDVTPLTPSGNATERHILAAYDTKAREVLGEGDELYAFWSDKLGIDIAESGSLVPVAPKFHEKLRSKLMKFGGVGYVAPENGSFPAIEDAIFMMNGMEALPTATWLDGTNPGEDSAMELLGLLKSKGIVAANIIPDRNWNIKDPENKALKIRKLDEFVKACRSFEMPIAVGTEMNKLGLPFVDDFSAEELQPYVGDFMDGARCLYGHTMLARTADFGYLSPGSRAAFGDDYRSRRLFFTKAGMSILSTEQVEKLANLRGKADPGAIMEILA